MGGRREAAEVCIVLIITCTLASAHSANVQQDISFHVQQHNVLENALKNLSGKSNKMLQIPNIGCIFVAVLNLSGTHEICQNRKFLSTNLQLQQQEKNFIRFAMDGQGCCQHRMWMMERWIKTKNAGTLIRYMWHVSTTNSSHGGGH